MEKIGDIIADGFKWELMECTECEEIVYVMIGSWKGNEFKGENVIHACSKYPGGNLKRTERAKALELLDKVSGKKSWRKEW